MKIEELRAKIAVVAMQAIISNKNFASRKDGLDALTTSEEARVVANTAVIYADEMARKLVRPVEEKRLTEEDIRAIQEEEASKEPFIYQRK